jgi:hypothetical protein
MSGDLFLDARNMFDARDLAGSGLRYGCIGREVPAPEGSLLH